MNLQLPAEQQPGPSSGIFRWWGNLALALVSLTLVAMIFLPP